MVTMPAPTLHVNGQPADPAHVRLPATILHGRSGPDSQPDAPTLTLEWGDPATTPALGDSLEWLLNLPAPSTQQPTYDDPIAEYDDPAATYGGEWLATVPRFVGTVTDVDMVEAYPGPAAARLVAVGGQAALGRIDVLAARPAESDLARVAAIAAAAGVPILTHGDPGPQLAAATVEGDALAALWEVCESSAGLVWQDTRGRLHYGTGSHREDATTVGVIPAHAILDGVVWQSTDADLVNTVTLDYGGDTAPGSHTVTDAQSVARWGVRAVSVSTGLADQAAADQLGALILARRAEPFWRLADIIVDTAHTDDVPAIITAASLAIGSTALIPIPPAPADVSGAPVVEWTVEGWAETWERHDRMTLQLAVTDRARWALIRLRVWADMQPHTWGSELARGSWLDTLTKQPGEALAA